jgi:hypothetical protein
MERFVFQARAALHREKHEASPLIRLANPRASRSLCPAASGSSAGRRQKFVRINQAGYETGIESRAYLMVSTLRNGV